MSTLQATNLKHASSASNNITLDTSGSVGIGTSSPANRFDVSGNAIIGDGTDRTPSATWDGQINVRGNAYTGGISLNATGMWVGHNSASRTLIFATDETERARITASGEFQFNNGYGSVATAFGCRAWVHFNGTGTVAIRASGNVSSITDNGAGDYTVNFTNAMSDTNYAVLAMNGAFFSGNQPIGFYESVSTARTASLVRLFSSQGTGATAIDGDRVSVAVFR